MNILEKIIAHKRLEVAEAKIKIPASDLKRLSMFNRPTFSMRKALETSPTGVIAEFKRKSPSEKVINNDVLVDEVTQGYVHAGASALSVLTDNEFFGGDTGDLIQARLHNNVPIIRKDFIVDEYQIIEAKAIGADAILLIAACLDAKVIDRLANFAHSLSMEVLLEVHDATELNSICTSVDMVGVNNRNLASFNVDINTSIELATKIPDQFIKVSESGIKSASSVISLRQHGFRGFLVGTAFMKSANPPDACKAFIDEILVSL